jgi:mRNA interferase RelE/StbE
MSRLRVPQNVAALIRNLHPGIKRKVRSGLADILRDPTAGKALKDELDGLRSYRLGRMRIIYRKSARGVIEVVAVGPRSTIYEATIRLLEKESR